MQQIADRIATVCDKDAFYGRIGGEEFAVFLHNRTLSDIKGIGNRLCSTLLVHVEGMPHPLRLTVSVGATEIKPSDTLPDALERADNALYYAKENGRAQLQLWRKDLKERAA